jgi:hypothetical protein
VELTFKSFRTETGYGNPICHAGDLLHIYDGTSQFNSKRIGVYCGTYLPANVYSSGTSLLLVFESDFSVQDKGFMIDYKAKKPGNLLSESSLIDTDVYHHCGLTTAYVVS